MKSFTSLPILVDLISIYGFRHDVDVNKSYSVADTEIFQSRWSGRSTQKTPFKNSPSFSRLSGWLLTWTSWSQWIQVSILCVYHKVRKSTGLAGMTVWLLVHCFSLFISAFNVDYLMWILYCMVTCVRTNQQCIKRFPPPGAERTRSWSNPRTV